MLDVAREIAIEIFRIIRRSRRLTRVCQIIVTLLVVLVGWWMMSWLMRPGLAVHGKVAWAGKPLTKGLISFHKIEGRAEGRCFAGAAIENGNYAIAAEHGLSPGAYVVRLCSPEPGAGSSPEGTTPPIKDCIPEKFNVNSRIVVEVSRFGRNRFDFTIP